MNVLLNSFHLNGHTLVFLALSFQKKSICDVKRCERSIFSVALCFVGVTYNVSLLRDVLNHPKFRLGDITTKFLPQEYPKGFKGKTTESQGC